MNVTIIVQARMGSSRLPGKVLLPCLGRPMLSYQIDRLRQVKYADRIVVATSDLPLDDPIAEFCRASGIDVFRGDVNDVLSRYAKTAQAFDADVIVRLTADCPLIDPVVVDHGIIKYLEFCGSDLYVSNVIDRTYPRGMDVEVFSRELLDEAHEKAESPYQREHVTPYMTQSEGVKKINFSLNSNLSAYRFTLDYDKDYKQISGILEGGLPDFSLGTLMSVAKRLGLDARDNSGYSSPREGVVRNFDCNAESNSRMRRFGLGAAQFGMYYGKFNREGVPSIESVRAILRSAQAAGLSSIDTAHLYGESEYALGLCKDEAVGFDIVTKTPRFSDDGIVRSDVDLMRGSFHNSLRLMGRSRVDGLLVHHAPNLAAPGGEMLYKELIALKNAGLVNRIGVSAYSGELVERLHQQFPIDFAQLPVNVLDRRLIDSGVLQRLADSGVKIHARSAFLQGLLLADPDHLSVHFNPAKPIIRAFQQAALEAGVTPAHAALDYLLGLPQIERIFVGVESLRQFEEIFGNFPDDVDMDYSRFRVDSESILNPVLWVN